MGLDGFSMSSLGLPKEVTSAQAAAAAEQLAQKGLDSKVENINKSLNKKINYDENKEKNNKEEFFNDGFEGEEDSEKDDSEEKNEDTDAVKNGTSKKRKKKLSKLNDTENLNIRFNEKNDTIELYNIQTRRTIESITAKDLLSMMSRLDNASGILVNKEI